MTGRYYHRLLWQGIINYIAEGNDLSYRKEKLPTPWHNDCDACLTRMMLLFHCYVVQLELRIERQLLSMEAWDD